MTEEQERDARKNLRAGIGCLVVLIGLVLLKVIFSSFILR